MQPTPNLFGESRISIEGNLLLQRIANRILELVKNNPELLDGDKLGQVDRKITLAIWNSEGLGNFISEDKREAFAKWFMEPKHCPDDETISRARRYLLAHDLIRVSSRAIQDAERQRQRIARSVKK